MDGLTIDIQRCPDGVELIDLPVAKTTVFRYRTERRETERITISNLENPLVIAFVNATDNERRQLFFGRFGLDSRSGRILWSNELSPTGMREELRCDEVIETQSRVRRLLQHLGGQDPASAITTINATIAEHGGFNLRPTFHLAGPRGTPRLLLKSDTLLGFMLMETAVAVAHGARLAECEKCSDLFLTGTLTGRRSHARFCSDRCRVAAMRARNAEAKIGGDHVRS